MLPTLNGWPNQKILPSSRLIVYNGIGHLPQEEAPEATLADLRKWLTKLQPDDEGAEQED